MYNKIEQITSNIGDMALKRRVISIITALDPKEDETILDCGCGDGIYLVTLKELVKANLHGFDADEVLLKSAKEHVNDEKVEFKKGDIHNLPYKDEYFDKIICTEVLEHVDNDKKAVKELCRVLKKGGKLVVTVPNHKYPFFWDPLNKMAELFFNMHIKSGFWAGIWNMHPRLYYVNEISDLIEGSGLKIIEKQALTHYSIPFNHIILYGLKNLLIKGVLPKSIQNTGDKFAYKESKQSKVIKLGYWFLSTIDKLNNNIPLKKSSVSILISSIK